MTIAIIGGGIAGLATALNLHRVGLPCRVYEAASTIRELGVGITLLPHAMRELESLGLKATVCAAGIGNRESAYFNRFGQKIFSEPRGTYAGYSQPEIGIHRGRLQGILYRAVIERLGAAAVVTDRQCVGFSQGDSAVVLDFRETSTGAALTPVAAGLVLACDGVNSVIRRQLYPQEVLAFTGINTWRGVTRHAPIFDGRTYLRIGSIRTGKIVVYPISDAIDGSGLQLVNWIAEIQRQTAPMNDWNKRGAVEDFEHIYASFRFGWLDVPELIRKADAVLEYPMVDRDPIGQWSFGRITLVGDAAHPMYPRGSNGSAQALIDARVLADLLAEGGSSTAALKQYEAQRAPVTAAIVQANRTRPPDVINLRVEELNGDKPFTDLNSLISQQELQRLSNEYKEIAGFSISDLGPG
jgi:2-polyprenyl-6-methoxyphenol hydroxylase-like FAD-dependent oxidoreductase